jgi:hypothetical protein
MEPQRTNLNTYSEAFDNSAWGKVSATITANTTISPDGYQNADTFTTSASGARIFQTLSLGAGTYTASLYVKKLSGSGNMRFFGVVDGGGVTQSFTPTDEWQRFTGNFTASTGITEIQLRENGFTGTLAIYGFQLEAGAYPTSYIPTNGTSVTRVADASLKTGISDLIGQTEGTLFFEIQDTEHFVSYFGVDNVSTGTRILVYGIDDQKVYAQVRNGGTIVFSASSAVISGRAKAAVSFNASGSVFYVNGTQVGSGSGTTYTNLSKFTLNHSSQVGSSLNKALLFTTRLDNATLATLTSL